MRRKARPHRRALRPVRPIPRVSACPLTPCAREALTRSRRRLRSRHPRQRRWPRPHRRRPWRRLRRSSRRQWLRSHRRRRFRPHRNRQRAVCPGRSNGAPPHPKPISTASRRLTTSSMITSRLRSLHPVTERPDQPVHFEAHRGIARCPSTARHRRPSVQVRKSSVLHVHL